MKVIPNEYDGPRSPVKRFPDTRFNLDYANSDNAAEIDTGIRETITGIRRSILAIGMGLAKLKNKGLYDDLGFRSMNDYLENLCDKMQIDRSTAHNWLWIGEAAIKYQRELESIKFTDADGPTKLPYVEKALEIHEKREVFKNIKDMSLRAFKDYSRGESVIAPTSKIKVVGNKLFIGKKLAVTLADDLDPKTRKYLTDINVKAGEALQDGEVLYTTRLYDMDELRSFQASAERLKKDMRKRR